MLMEEPQLLRTKENYNEDFFTKNIITGIKELCIFNDIVDFDITKNKSLDLMNDFLEGVAHYTLSKLLTCIINKNKLLYVEKFNKLLEKFDYENSDSINKPQPIALKTGKKRAGEKIQNKIKFKQSAAETSTLCKYLGLIIGSYIPIDYEYWKIYIILRQIHAIVTSPKILKSNISILENLIMKHNNLYIQYFGNLKPKMHFLIHVPRVLRDNGPLVHFWSMANERKNKQLKDIATVTTSHRNMPLTIATRIMLQQCHRKETCENVRNDSILGAVDEDNDYEILQFDSAPPSKTTYKSVIKCGKQYCIGTIIITGYHESEPKFGKIIKIYGNSNDIRFLIGDIIFDIFEHHFQAYRIISISKKPTSFVKLHLTPYFNGPCMIAKVHQDWYLATNYCTH